MIFVKTCIVCGNEVMKTPTMSKAYWKTRKFCSHKCYGVNKIGELSHRQGKSNIVEYGTERALEISRKIANTLSVPCISKKCLFCSKTFIQKNGMKSKSKKFCSRTCALKFRWEFTDTSELRKKIGETNKISQLGNRNMTQWHYPTSYENRIVGLVEKHSLPYKYVGDGSFWITSEGKHLNPDFVNVNGEKKVIEVYSEFYKKLSYGTVENYKKERTKLFGNFGLQVVFLDDGDLFSDDWEEHCLKKINGGI